MNLLEFLDRYDHKRIDFDGAFGYQCVDLYRAYVREVLGFPQSPPVPQGAADIWTTYQEEYYTRIDNAGKFLPRSGDIVIWSRDYGKFGHVAICVISSPEFLICFSQNDPTSTSCRLKIYKYEHIQGWLRPKLFSGRETDL